MRPNPAALAGSLSGACGATLTSKLPTACSGAAPTPCVMSAPVDAIKADRKSALLFMGPPGRDETACECRLYPPRDGRATPGLPYEAPPTARIHQARPCTLSSSTASAVPMSYDGTR